MELTVNWLQQTAADRPEYPALVFEGKTWTFAQMETEVQQLAQRLIAVVAQGDRVAVLMDNQALLVLLIHALTRLGAIAVMLNTRLTPVELAWQLQDCQASSVIHDHSQADLVHKTTAHSTTHSTDLNLLNLEEDEEDLVAIYPLLTPFLPASINLHSIQSVMYTSGTTGKPKGVQLSYGNHFHSATATALHLGIQSERDAWLACLPLFHVGGLSIIWRCAIYGIPLILHRRFDPEAIIEAIASTINPKISVISLVPTMLSRLLESPDFKIYLSVWQQLRCILLGGAALSQQLQDKCQQWQLPIAPTYGLTETASQVATLLPQDAQRKPGSSGLPLSCNHIRIVAVADRAIALPAGEIGQILVCGSNVMAGYINQDEDSANSAINDDWLCTGDLGYIDSEGYLYVVNRRTDLIVSGGENIYPAEVESVLLRHPAISEACVIGVDDCEWGQQVVAVLVMRSPLDLTLDLTLEGVKQFCLAQHLAKFKLPKAVYLVAALPKTDSGKLRRQELHQLLAQIIAANQTELKDTRS